jgi:Prokaryotic phospholipase A2
VTTADAAGWGAYLAGGRTGKVIRFGAAAMGRFLWSEEGGSGLGHAGWVCAAAIALFAMVALVSAETAKADHAPEVSLFAQDDAVGYMSASAWRTGWAVEVQPNYFVAPEADCHYWEAKLVVDGGRDPDKKFGPYCGQSIDYPLNLRRLKAAEGRRLTHIEIKFCTVKSGIDPCDKDRVALPQHERHASAGRIARTVGFFDVSLRRFMELKRARPRPDIWDWSDNGCSAPFDSVSATWKQRFKRACLRHDFGYRNFGAGHSKSQWFDPKDKRRRFVDERFGIDMRNICEAHDWNGCKSVAGTFFVAVRDVGGKAFYGA